MAQRFPAVTTLLGSLVQFLAPTRGAHLSATLVPGDLIPSSGLSGYQAGMWYTDTGAGKTTQHIKQSFKKKKKK